VEVSGVIDGHSAWCLVYAAPSFDLLGACAWYRLVAVIVDFMANGDLDVVSLGCDGTVDEDHPVQLVLCSRGRKAGELLKP
jgi:hypothetical protein